MLKRDYLKSPYLSQYQFLTLLFLNKKLSTGGVNNLLINIYILKVGGSGEICTFTAVFQLNIKKLVRFLGNIDAKTDAKGRVFIPASFRKILQASGNTYLVLKKDAFQDCLVLYPETTWNEELDTLRARLNVWNEEQQNIFRNFIQDVETLEIDSSGRVLLPKRYLQMAGIISDVRFMGMYDKIEIWSKDCLEKTKMDSESFKRGLEKYMA